jgi:hypothetical protein
MTTTWTIANIKRKPDTGLVFEVTYIMNFKLENKEDRHVGMVELEGDASDPNFVPFNELTQETVLGWVQTKLGEEEITRIQTQMETRLQERIDRENNPEFLQGLPWEVTDN